MDWEDDINTDATGWEDDRQTDTDDWKAELDAWDMDRYLRTVEEYYGSEIGPPTGRIESAICHSPFEKEFSMRVEDGLIYDNRGNLIGELPLEEPNPFLDPVNYLSGLGGWIAKSRILFPRLQGTGKSDIIIKWPKGYKTRVDITHRHHNKPPHIHPWTKE